MASTCFVRNLAYTVTDASLEDHFSTIGPVRRAFVVRDRQSKQSRELSRILPNFRRIVVNCP